MYRSENIGMARPPWERTIEDIFSSGPRIESAGAAESGSLVPSSKKKVACRVWLVRCSLYVGEGGSRVGNWRGVNVAGRGFGTSQFVMGRVSSGPGVCQPLANPQALAAMDRRARAVRGRRHVS